MVRLFEFLRYTNRRGRWLLRSFNQTKADLASLETRTEEQHRRLEQKVHALEVLTKTLIEEVHILRPLKETAVNIRKRLFAAHCRKEGLPELWDQGMIDSGNLVAHGGDIRTDISLFKNKLIDLDDAFSELYGLEWKKAEGLLCYN